MRRHGLPLCTGRGTSAYAVNEESPSPIGPGALQAPGHPRAAAAALLRCWWRGPDPAALVIGTELLQQINTLVLPHVAKLARLVERDSAAVEYVHLIETNLQTLTSSLASKMARVFQALTATEADVAHLVMRGLTTKDIAATLSRAPSTIDFHRNNIRGKLGVERRVTLRAYLLSIR